MIFKSKVHPVIYFEPSELKAATFKEILPYFFQETEEDMAVIKIALKENKTHDIRMIAHKIKGTAISYGAVLIHEMAKNIHDIIDHSDTSKLDEQISELEQAIAHSYDFAIEEFGI